MDVFHGFLTVIDEAVLPSLSLLNCNCGAAEEVWSMVKQLPYEKRYWLLYTVKLDMLGDISKKMKFVLCHTQI